MEVHEINAEYKELNQDVTRFIFGEKTQIDKNKINSILPITSSQVSGGIGFADTVLATRQVPTKFGNNEDIVRNGQIVRTLTVVNFQISEAYKNSKQIKQIIDFLIQKANSFKMNNLVFSTHNDKYLIQILHDNGFNFYANSQFAIKNF